MTRRTVMLIVIAALAGGGLVAMHRDRPVAAAPRPTAGQLLDANIEFYEAVAARDRTGAMALGQLALLYMRRARATGDYQDVLRSEDAARRSLTNRAAHNTRARQALAASLLSEHRFT